MDTLWENSFSKRNIHTSSLNYGQENSAENEKTLKEQKVELKMICAIKNIRNNVRRAEKLLDDLFHLDISIGLKLQFGVKEERKLIKKCRKAAYKDGLEKAKQYAAMSGMKIKKPAKISEIDPKPKDKDNKKDSENENKEPEPLAQLPMGRVKKTMKLYMDFEAT